MVLLSIVPLGVALGAGIILVLLMPNEASAQPMPEESGEATEIGKILTLGRFLPLLIIVAIAIIGIIAVWIVRKKHLIF